MHFNSDLLIAEHKTYCTDFIKYHIRYSENLALPDCKVCVISYPDDLKISVNNALNRQIEIWKGSDRKISELF